MDISVGDDFIIDNYTLDTNAQNITTTRAFKSVVFQTRNASTWLFRRLGTDSKFVTVAPGDKVRLDCHRIPGSGATTVICDARLSAGSDILEALFTI